MKNSLCVDENSFNAILNFIQRILICGKFTPGINSIDWIVQIQFRKTYNNILQFLIHIFVCGEQVHTNPANRLETRDIWLGRILTSKLHLSCCCLHCPPWPNLIKVRSKRETVPRLLYLHSLKMLRFWLIKNDILPSWVVMDGKTNRRL